MTGLPPVFPGNRTWFVSKLFTALAESQPACNFTWWQHKPVEEAGLPPNITIANKRRTKSAWPLTAWWTRTITEKKLAANGVKLFIAIDEPPMKFKKISRCMLFTRREGMPSSPEEKQRSGNSGLKKLLASFHHADCLLTLFPSHAEWVKNRFPFYASRIRLLLPAPEDNNLPSSAGLQKVKDQFSGGVDYFLVSAFAGDDKDLLPVLKGYSLFKKWQLSHMQLLVTVDPSADMESLRSVLASYKYRNDVKLIEGISDDEWVELLGAAYCLVHPSLHDHFPVNILRAMASGIPVISAPVPEVLDLAADTIIYSEFTAEALGANLQLIYKDEELRARMTAKAKERVGQRHEKEMAASCWNYLLPLINSK
jgi:glycosyltransferase involved in cell wall biosynthesis